MAVSDPATALTPWLPEGRTAVLPGRGEIFYRWFAHPDPAAPVLLLLHGWTADADTQFFSAYEALAERYSFIAVDHRGHGRGIRSQRPFTLEDVADDAAALVRQLGIEHVVTVGYSMGGPVGLLLARRHPELVVGMVHQATALEWRSTRRDRAQWWLLIGLGAILRNRLYPHVARRAIGRLVGDGNVDLGLWIGSELSRNDPGALVQAGRALSRYDARVWASEVDKPAACLVTTRDHIVPPAKQRALAAATRAHVEELAADHSCTITHPAEYTAATPVLVDHVVARVTVAPSGVAG